jgi:hypothetical protein
MVDTTRGDHRMRRAVDCKCGEHIEAPNDSALLDAFRRHAEEDHPDWGEGELKVYLVGNAYDQMLEGSRS